MASDNQSVGSSFLEIVKTVVYALLIAGVFRTVFYQPFFIPSGSMKETLLIGDFLFVNKMAYGYSYASCPSFGIPLTGVQVDAEQLCGWTRSENGRLFGREPEQGDVVVFRHPLTGQDYIKRVIGRPGDRIAIRDGQLYLNGIAVSLRPDGYFEEIYQPQGAQQDFPRCVSRVGPGGVCVKERFIETLPNGREHLVLNIGPDRFANMAETIVPEGHYFMMGDNRDNSADSRIPVTRRGVGMVPFENIVGRADRVIFSSSGRRILYFWTWRSDRFFHAIR